MTTAVGLRGGGEDAVGGMNPVGRSGMVEEEETMTAFIQHDTFLAGASHRHTATQHQVREQHCMLYGKGNKTKKW